MDLFLTGRLGKLPAPWWSGDERLGDAQSSASVSIPPAPSLAKGKASDLSQWRALLRELAP